MQIVPDLPVGRGELFFFLTNSWRFGILLLTIIGVLLTPLLYTFSAHPFALGSSNNSENYSSPSSPVIGVVYHWWTPLDVSTAKSTGVNWIRTDVSFSPEFSEFLKNYSGENFVGILNDQILGARLDDSGCYYGCSWTLTQWDSSVKSAVFAYPQIHVWEIWNEPQITQNQNGYLSKNVTSYFNLLKDAYQIIKSHNSSDTVLCLGGDNIYYGGYTTYYAPDYQWARQLWNLGAAKYCDAISLHAYSAKGYILTDVPDDWVGHPGNATLGQIYVDAVDAYENLTGKPIWITEVGLPANNGSGYTTFAHVPSPSNSQQKQALFLNQSFSLFLRQPAVRGVFWFEMTGLEDYPYKFDYGLFTTNGTSRLALEQFKGFLHIKTNIIVFKSSSSSSISISGASFSSSDTQASSSIMSQGSGARYGGLVVHQQASTSSSLSDPLSGGQPEAGVTFVIMPFLTFCTVMAFGYAVLRKAGIYSSRD